MTQKSPSAHSRTTLSGYIFATKACIDNRKNLLNSNMSCNMANFGPLWLRSVREFGTLQQISACFVTWLRYGSDVTHRRPTKLCTMFGRLLGWYRIYSFLGTLAPDGMLSGAKFTLRPSLAFSYICSVTARHSSSGHQPNVAEWYKEWNYRTFAAGATYSRLGGHHFGHRPTF